MKKLILVYGICLATFMANAQQSSESADFNKYSVKMESAMNAASKEKDYPKAIALFDEAMRRDWRFIEPYIEKGIILYEQKNYDEALKTFQFATNISYTNADCYYWTGRCYEAISKKEEAIDYYYKALTFDKNFKEAREALKRLKVEKVRGE